MVFVCFVFISTSISQRPSSKEVRAGTQGRNLEVEVDEEAMEECCLLVLSPRLAYVAFLYTSHLDRATSPKMSLTGVTSIINYNSSPFPRGKY